MKYLSLLFFSYILFSCDDLKHEVASQNLFDQIIPKDGLIAEAEKNLGTLVKEERTFKDENTGSTFRMVFAARSSGELEDFFYNNSVIFQGINEEEKNDIISKKKSYLDILSSDDSENFEDFVESPVYYDLISKKLGKEAVGFSFTIKPKYISQSSSSLRPSGNSWRQQTSLPWCEVATLHAITESYPLWYTLTIQTRGLIWNGSGAPIASIYTNGSSYGPIGIDGPKFTRFGGPDPVASKFTVTWYDWESGSSVSN